MEKKRCIPFPASMSTPSYNHALASTSSTFFSFFLSLGVRISCTITIYYYY
ncbi:hypothetical protein MtrunA17_Chr1g0201871 [Medicago truncatula]|uniref:Transmembrane protein, putative n=1 Tax=Medicago truncatula TaxID=3880 RepID=G7ICY0_MEDTR|nr:transmembrane protein, putative [Medicago truncatula]RHN81690.1 hypothetical protein MtrunA17_Chr1g0201871 [Medicago truncatula]